MEPENGGPLGRGDEPNLDDYIMFKWSTLNVRNICHHFRADTWPKRNPILVGGWTTHLKKYQSNWVIFPNFRGENFKNIFETSYYTWSHGTFSSPIVGGHVFTIVKGSRELTIPKSSPAELPGWYAYYISFLFAPNYPKLPQFSTNYCGKYLKPSASYCVSLLCFSLILLPHPSGFAPSHDLPRPALDPSMLFYKMSSPAPVFSTGCNSPYEQRRTS